MKHSHTAALFLLLFLVPLVTIQARADRSYLQPESIYLGDIAELVIEYDNSIPSLYALDTSELEKDFELLRKDSRVFRLKDTAELVHRMQWRLQITPRRSGRLQIPPIRYGDRWTSPRHVDVGVEKPGEHRLFIELDSSTPTPYVGQQTRIITRLYFDSPSIDGSLEAPRAEKLRIQRSTTQQRYTIERDGQALQVLEQEFALFPQQAGPLTLSPADYRTTFINTPASADTPALRRRLIRRSEALTLEVKAPPVNYGGRFWLPAAGLKLSQQWGRGDGELRIGDSLDWSLTIVAKGLPAESLPQDLLTRSSGNLRVYADQAVLTNHFEKGTIIGRLEQRFAVIVTAPGRIDLPQVRLKWWDVVNDREAESHLEGRSFNVSGIGTRTDTLSFPQSPMDSSGRTFVVDARPWFFLLISLSVLAAAVVGFRQIRFRLRDRIEIMRQRRRAWQRLERACRTNDAIAARTALLDWARQRWRGETIVGLRQVASRILSDELRPRLDELDAALYSSDAGNWNGQALWRVVAGLARQRQRAHIPAMRLPQPYPDQA